MKELFSEQIQGKVENIVVIQPSLRQTYQEESTTTKEDNNKKDLMLMIKDDDDADEFILVAK